MNTAKLIKEIPYQIPSNVISELDSYSDLSEKLNIIRKWVHTNNEINHEKRLNWHKPILKLAQKNRLLEDEAISLSNMVKIRDRLGLFEESLNAIEKVQKIWIGLCAKNEKYYHNLIVSYCDKSVTLRLQNRLPEALNTLYEGYEIIKKNGLDYHDALIILFSDLGIIYEKMLDYPAALNYFNQSLNLIKRSQSNNIENQILCHINIGNVYKASNRLNLACSEYNKAINLTSKYKQYKQHYIISHINLGETLSGLKEYKQALLIFSNALKVCKKSGSDMDLGFIYLLMAQVYIDINNIKEYDKAIKKGKNLVEKANYPNDVIFLNYLRYKKHALNKDFKKGISLLLKSVEICKKHNLEQHLLKTYKELSNVFKDANNIDKAFQYSNKYIEHRDTVDKNMHKFFLDQKQQSLNRMQEEINSIKEREEKKVLELELQFKKRELISKKLHSISNRDFLNNIYNSLKNIPSQDDRLKNILRKFKHEITSSSSWSDYLKAYKEIDSKFITNLRKASNKLSPTEIRVCSLIRLGLDNYEIASFMSISKRSVEQHRYRIKKKLDTEVNLTEYILSLS